MARFPWTGVLLMQALPATLALPTDPPAGANPILAVPSEDWAALNATVSGRLHIGRPVGLPCYTRVQNLSGLSENPSADEEACAEVREERDVSTAIISSFGSYHNPTFATCMAKNQTCAVSPALPEHVLDETCYQGQVPDYYIDALEVEDIQAGLLFAKEHKLQISVKNTGHDYKGRSTGLNTLSIWVRHMLYDPIYHDEFVPEGCDASAGLAGTLSAAQTSMGLYEKLRGTGYMIAGGACATTGVAGGWLAGGGHSIFSPVLGLGVDNVLELKVVLPNGEAVVASRCQNEDIFFALRGGSGGTFGVVYEATFRLYEDREIIHSYMNITVPDDAIREVNEILVENAEKWADEGWGGVLGFVEEGVFLLTSYNIKLSFEEAEESLAPLKNFLESVSSDEAPFEYVFETLPNQYAAQTTPELTALLQTEAGVSLTRSSRLVPRDLYQTAEGREALVDILVARPWLALLVAPAVYELPESDLPGGPGYASVTPAWRNSLWHVVYLAAWDPADPAATSPEALTKVFTQVSKDMDPLRALTPNSGAYQSESDVYEPNYIQSFWGQENYDRLLSIKEELDPDNMMTCFTCVGWKPDSPRYSCYPQVRSDVFPGN